MLDENRNYALSFHSVWMVWDDNSHRRVLFHPNPIQDTYTLQDLLKSNFIASCSPMYRRSMFPGYPPWFFVMPVGDWTHHVLHAQHGPIGYIDEPMGVYRQHRGGIYSMRKETEKLRVAIEMLRRFQCVLGRKVRPIVNRSLCEHYCRLARQCCEDGDLVQARASVRECLYELRLGAQIPIRDLLKVILRVSVPGLHSHYRGVIAKMDSGSRQTGVS